MRWMNAVADMSALFFGVIVSILCPHWYSGSSSSVDGRATDRGVAVMWSTMAPPTAFSL